MALDILCYFYNAVTVSFAIYYISDTTITGIEPSTGGIGGNVKVTIYGSGELIT